MKRYIILFIVTMIFNVYAQASIIWNFDTPATSPANVARLGYFYVYAYSTVAGKGIGGSNALEITVPAFPRTWGGGFMLGNTQPINLASGSSTTASVYWSIMANETSSFGVSFEVYDTTGNKFIPPGVLYTGYSSQFNGSISTSAFQKVTWNVGSFAYYKYVYSPLTIIRDQTKHPLLSAISTMSWIFPTNILSGATSGSGSNTNLPELTFYLDNVGVISSTGISYNDWSVFSQEVISSPKENFALRREQKLLMVPGNK